MNKPEKNNHNDSLTTPQVLKGLNEHRLDSSDISTIDAALHAGIATKTISVSAAVRALDKLNALAAATDSLLISIATEERWSEKALANAATTKATYEQHTDAMDSSATNPAEGQHYAHQPALAEQMLVGTTTGLEKYEKEKYNYLVNTHDFGMQPKRQHHIDKMRDEYGKLSEKYMEILYKGQSSRLLEIGIGPGTFMKWVEDKYDIETYGIDISDAMVAFAQGLFPNLASRMTVGNARSLPYADGYFNIVQHLDGMEHIPPLWEGECLKEAARVSKKYIVYNNATQDAQADSWCSKGGYTAAHINVKSCDEWSEFYMQHSKAYGYKIIEEYKGDWEYVVILEKINQQEENK